jgi:MFS family permease
MLQTQAPGQGQGQSTEFDTRVRAFRSGVMIAAGVFGGTVLGGIVGLFVYAQSRTPNVHDGVFAVIQVAGVILGLVMGLAAARGAEAQDQLLDASQRAGTTMLKKYKPKPGTTGQANVGQRVIKPASAVDLVTPMPSAGQQVSPAVANAGEEFLKTLLNGKTQ